MNARQKAKKYKKMAERYKDKANAWDSHLTSELWKSAYRRSRYGTIETLKVVKFLDDRFPEEFIKKSIAQDLAECLLREGYIDFKIDDDYNGYNMGKRIIGTLKVTKGGFNDDIY